MGLFILNTTFFMVKQQWILISFVKSFYKGQRRSLTSEAWKNGVSFSWLSIQDWKFRMEIHSTLFRLHRVTLNKIIFHFSAAATYCDLAENWPTVKNVVGYVCLSSFFISVRQTCIKFLWNAWNQSSFTWSKAVTVTKYYTVKFTEEAHNKLKRLI